MKKFTIVLGVLLNLIVEQTLIAGRSFEGNWSSLSVTTDPQKSYSFNARVETRVYYEENDHRGELVLLAAMGFRPIKKLMLSFAYQNYQRFHDANRVRRVPWQQAQFDVYNSDRLVLNSRTRIEEQFSSVDPGTSYRLRQHALITFNSWEKYTIVPTFFNEAFFNLNHPDWVSKKVFSQNRTFVGIRFPFNKKISLLAGYLRINQYLTDENLTDNLLSTTIDINLG